MDVLMLLVAKTVLMILMQKQFLGTGWTWSVLSYFNAKTVFGNPMEDVESYHTLINIVFD